MSILAQSGRIPSFDLSDRLRKAREDAGFDQDQLAAQIGVARRSISNYERGLTKPRRPVLVSWALATGIDATWLETGTAPTDDGEGPKLPRLDSNQQPFD